MKQGTIHTDARRMVRLHEQRLAGTRLRLHLRRQMAREQMQELDEVDSAANDPAGRDAERAEG
jgi:hypothetical protein